MLDQVAQNSAYRYYEPEFDMVLEQLQTIRASQDQDALQDYISHRQASTLRRLNVSFTLPKASGLVY